MFFVASIWAVSCKYLLCSRILLMSVFQKFEWLNLEHIYRVVSILFPGVESIQSCSISILSFCILFYRRGTSDPSSRHFLELMMLTNSGLREAPPTRKPSTSGWSAISDCNQPQ